MTQFSVTVLIKALNRLYSMYPIWLQVEGLVKADLGCQVYWLKKLSVSKFGSEWQIANELPISEKLEDCLQVPEITALKITQNLTVNNKKNIGI